MPDFLLQYEQRHNRNIADIIKQIAALYESSLIELSVTASQITLNGETFSIKDYPGLQAKIDRVVASLHPSIYATIVNGVNAAWNLSNQKNDVLVSKVLNGKLPAPKMAGLLYDPNHQALASFIARKEKGLNLSKRVWNALEPFYSELEMGLGLGISNGQSAADMARDLQQYLSNPDKLFRRVRDEEGKLKLSQAAKNYNPGQGVYRSSFKNALRLTASETNISYRTADHERWKKMDFVIGIEVHTSDSHPKYDICDELKGDYPKDFKFTGWHTRCICFAIPKLLTSDQYSQYEDQLLGLSNEPLNVDMVEEPPAAFTQYLKDNRVRIEGWKSKPYWWKDNQKYL